MALLAVGAVSRAQGGFDFPGPQCAPASGAIALAFGDLDLDGVPDAVTANFTSLSAPVSVLRGNGAAGFVLATELVSGDFPSHVELGDFDLDGLGDIIVLNSNSLWLFFGLGQLQFSPATTIGVPLGATALAVGDLDLDGDLDLAVGSNVFSGGQTGVLLGAGDGSFAPFVTVKPGSAVWMAIGDLTDDSIPDLLASAGSGSLIVLPGVGDGTFLPSFVLPGGAVADGRIADLDGAGTNDIVVADFSKDRLMMHEGLGGGIFAPSEYYPIGDGPLGLDIADLDGDGQLDAFACSRIDGKAWLLWGAGGSTFAPAIELLVGGEPEDVRIADLDADGWPDAGVVTAGDNGLVILRNEAGSFLGAPPAVAPTGDQPSDLLLADLDLDGHQDAITTYFLSDDVSVLLGDGQGGFGAAPSLATGDEPVAAAVGHVNADAYTDLVVLNDGTDDVNSQIGMGTGAFLGAETFLSYGSARDIVLAEFDGDGKTDVAIASSGLHVRLGLGNGNFEKELLGDTGGYSAALTVLDWNADGEPDLAATNLFPANLALLQGVGDGTFGPPRILPAPPALDILAMDVDSDGDSDLVVSDTFGGSIWLLRRTAPGLFALPVPYPTGLGPRELHAADLDGDGTLDLAVEHTGAVSLHHGLRDGGFRPPTTLAAYAKYVGIHVDLADLDEDGQTDIALSGIGLAVLLNP
jgi:hypothetical protein